jgi:hypothetical protein
VFQSSAVHTAKYPTSYTMLAKEEKGHTEIQEAVRALQSISVEEVTIEQAAYHFCYIP